MNIKLEKDEKNSDQVFIGDFAARKRREGWVLLASSIAVQICGGVAPMYDPVLKYLAPITFIVGFAGLITFVLDDYSRYVFPRRHKKVREQ